MPAPGPADDSSADDSSAEAAVIAARRSAQATKTANRNTPKACDITCPAANGFRSALLPDFWKGHWRHVWVSSFADDDQGNRHAVAWAYPRFVTTMLTEVWMHIGSVLLVIWLVIGGIAAGQRGDYKRPVDCSSFSTAAVTILAGGLNYAHVDPHINCTTPHPSS